MTYKYLWFKMKRARLTERKRRKAGDRIKEKLEEPTGRVDVFETKNWIHCINQNIMSIVMFYSGPVKFTLGGLTESTS